MKPFINKKLLCELPFHRNLIKNQIIKPVKWTWRRVFEEPNITKYSNAFKKYAPNFAFKVLDSRNPEIHLDITKTQVKNKLKDLMLEFWKVLNFK